MHSALYLSDLFDPAPDRWGMPGDRTVWRQMRELVDRVPIPVSGVHDWLCDAFMGVVGEDLREHPAPSAVWVTGLVTDGAMSGATSLAWWTDVGMPTLVRRAGEETCSRSR